jgi:LacI family transcriptional regulator
MSPSKQNSSPDFEQRPSAAQVFASLDEERSSDPILGGIAARELDSSHARAGEQSEPLLIGIVSSVPDLPQTMHPFFGPVLAGIKARLVAAHADMFVPNYNPDSPTGADPTAIERCYSHGVQGLIVMGIGAADLDIGPVLESGRPIIMVDYPIPTARVGYVMSNNLEGMASAVRHLYRLGRRRIATITGLMHTRPAIDRVLGYRSELSRLGLEERPEYVVEGDFYQRSGHEQMQRLLALSEPPDAVTTASDMTAVGAIVAIEEAGLRVPDDIAVVGFDDSPFASAMQPALTTVRQDALGLGMAAADGILAMLDHPDDPPTAILLPTQLVVRESCGIELRQSVSSSKRATS